MIRSPGAQRLYHRRIFALIFAAAVAIAGIVAVATAPPRAQAAPTAAPLVWGENLIIDTGSLNSDPFLTSSALRAGLVAAHTHIIRLPVRGPNPSTSGIANWPEFQAAATDIKNLGLVPLVILRNPQDPALLADDSQAVRYMTSLFSGPDDTVYYEWANETDLSGASFVSASTYVTSWNATVPQLKSIAGSNAKWIGPVNFQYDAAYLQTFLQSANPLPDAVSWHEYTCGNGDSEAFCLSHIDNWTTHIGAARSLMTSTIGFQLPIWITEWNYNPNISGDTKSSDRAFLAQWTTKALQVLAANGVAASMHYNVQGLLPLVNSDGSLATEGTAFKSQYEALVGTPSPTPSDSSSPAPNPSSSPSPSGGSSPTPTPSGAAPRYSFEDGGLDGWSKSGNITSLTNSTGAGGQDGAHALAITYHSTSASDLPYVHTNPPTGPTTGVTLTAFLYLPTTTTNTVAAKLFVQDSAFTWHQANPTTITTHGSWTQLSYLTTGYTGNAIQIGLQLSESPTNTDTTLYLDSVTW